jgi:hypothetical protein
MRRHVRTWWKETYERSTLSPVLTHLCHWPPVFAVTHNKGWQAKAACLVDDQLLVQTLEATAQRVQPTVRRPRDRGDTTR